MLKLTISDEYWNEIKQRLSEKKLVTTIDYQDIDGCECIVEVSIKTKKKIPKRELIKHYKKILNKLETKLEKELEKENKK